MYSLLLLGLSCFILGFLGLSWEHLQASFPSWLSLGYIQKPFLGMGLH